MTLDAGSAIMNKCLSKQVSCTLLRPLLRLAFGNPTVGLISGWKPVWNFWKQSSHLERGITKGVNLSGTATGI